jgi:GT2 family glycosyltransferase
MVSALGQDSPPRVVVAVLTWRAYEVTRACLESLVRAYGWPFPLAVVDNGSGTGEGRRLAYEFGPPVVAVELPDDGGVPSGYNAGIAWARDAGATHVLLLNNDTICSDPHLIERLIAAAQHDVAVVGPIVRGPSGALQSAGGILRWWRGRAEQFDEAHIPRADGPYDVDWIDGSCMLVTIAAADRIGALEPAFFLYWEEVDWCVRARKAGLRCVVEPRTAITHIGTASITSDTQLRQFLRNKLFFMRRNAGWPANASTFAIFVLLTIPRHVIRQGLSPRGWLNALSAGVDAITWNIADARQRGRWLVPPTAPSA